MAAPLLVLPAFSVIRTLSLERSGEGDLPAARSIHVPEPTLVKVTIDPLAIGDMLDAADMMAFDRLVG